MTGRPACDCFALYPKCPDNLINWVPIWAPYTLRAAISHNPEGPRSPPSAQLLSSLAFLYAHRLRIAKLLVQPDSTRRDWEDQDRPVLCENKTCLERFMFIALVLIHLEALPKDFKSWIKLVREIRDEVTKANRQQTVRICFT